jgi:hypothetical protein
MASLLATLVLDDEAMSVLRQRGEGHLVFEATLKLVREGGILVCWGKTAGSTRAALCQQRPLQLPVAHELLCGRRMPS